MSQPRVRILVPAAMIGAGSTAPAIDRGIALGADAIAIDLPLAQLTLRPLPLR